MTTTTKAKVQSRTTKKTKEIKSNPSDNHQRRKPSEEEIRRKAEELYNERLVSGEYGTALDDWQKAEQLLSE